MFEGIDVAQSKFNQLEFDKAASYLQNLISLMPGNFYWKDSEGHYLNCNE